MRYIMVSVGLKIVEEQEHVRVLVEDEKPMMTNIPRRSLKMAIIIMVYFCVMFVLLFANEAWQ